MVLVSYSDSESDTSQSKAQCPATSTTQSSRKRKIKSTLDPPTSTKKSPPPLPSAFHSLYATNVRTSTTDDPSLHGGRKRQVTHVQGNWPSHVFLEWLPDKSQLISLDDLVQRTRRTIILNSTLSEHDFEFNTFLRSSLSAQLPLHVSLSAPLVLDTLTKDEFRDTLINAIGAVKIGEISLRPASLDLVPNFDKSRWFLVLRVGQTDIEKLMTLLRACNDTCDAFNLPLLYQRSDLVGVDTATDKTSYGNTRSKAGKDAEAEVVDVESTFSHKATNAFHISIAWTLKEVSENIRNAVRCIDLEMLGESTIQFDKVKIKIGNVVDDILL